MWRSRGALLTRKVAPVDTVTVCMNPPSDTFPFQSQLTDIVGLRMSGVFPQGREPCIRTLREWTRLRRIPHHRVGHFVYYDPAEVAMHIRVRLRVPARGEVSPLAVRNGHNDRLQPHRA